MRKLFAIIIGLLCLAIIAMVASYAALHTKYAADVVNGALKLAYQDKVQVRSVQYSYQDPSHLQLNGVLIKPQATKPTLIEQMDIWLHPSLWQQNKLQIDNLIIDGLALQDGWPEIHLSQYLHINQITLAHLDFAHDAWVGRDVSLQIKHPQKRDSRLFPFYGEIRLSAEQLYWQGEALNNVFFDGDITPTHTTFYDLRFHWRQGQFAAQATKKQSEQEWQVPHATISGLRLQQADFESISQTSLDGFKALAMRIHDLDLRQSSIDTPRFTANNIQLTASNLELPFQLWQQQDASIFVTAEDMGLFGQAINAPALDLSLQKNRATIHDISLEMLQGNLHLQGTVTPSSLMLNQLNINNMKWFPTPETKHLVWHYLDKLDDIEAQMLTLNNLQFIDLTTTPPLQTTGLSIEGDQVQLKRDKHWGLWKGKLSLSASSATYDSVNSKNPLLTMHSEQGHFWLDKLFVPLDNGLVKGTGDIAFAQTSQPWKLNLEASGIPLRFFSRWFNLPLHLDGITDFTLKGEGLYGDPLIFKHSVTGELSASVTRATSQDDFQTLWLRNQGIELPPLAPPKPGNQGETPEDKAANDKRRAAEAKDQKKAAPVTISDIHLVADRGRLSLKPFTIEATDFSAHLGGDYDFLFPNKGNLHYRLEGKCQALTFNLLGNKDAVQVENNCH